MRNHTAVGLATALTAVFLSGCSSSEPDASPLQYSTDSVSSLPTAGLSPNGKRLPQAVNGWYGEPELPDTLSWPRSDQVTTRVYIKFPTRPSAVTINTFSTVDSHGIPDERTQRGFPCATEVSDVEQRSCRVRKERQGLWAIDMENSITMSHRYALLNAEWHTDTPTFMTWQLP